MQTIRKGVRNCFVSVPAGEHKSAWCLSEYGWNRMHVAGSETRAQDPMHGGTIVVAQVSMER